MGKTLFRHNLDYDKAIVYTREQLIFGNTLSKELLNVLDFEKGKFFTLLPDDADLTRIYEFPYGWILPQNETIEYINESGGKSSFSWTPTVKNEISSFISEKLRLKTNRVCIFEDVVQLLSDPHIKFFHEYGLLYINELYYLVNGKNSSQETIASAIGEANALWHLVFILTESDKSYAAGQEITLGEIKEFCKDTQLLIIGAYDGEGFVLWEP